jgi:hypothetical protein
MHSCLQRQDLRSALSAICRLLPVIRDTPATKKLAWSERIREGPEFTRASLPRQQPRVELGQKQCCTPSKAMPGVTARLPTAAW